MIEEKEPTDGGPAFSGYFKGRLGEVNYHEGMTKRDLFAAFAMAGMLACSRNDQAEKEVWKNGNLLAEWSYDIAEVMLRTRSKKHFSPEL